ncbi:MAG: hypothetical protein HY700_22190 [Gemmatimonadetes bacterium]|nr:hypothetical protein [Gemmatimonadota bacterium]
MLHTTIVLCVYLVSLPSQDPKIDSLQFVSHRSVEQTDSAVAAAFRNVGLTVTRADRLMVEADESGAGGISGGQVRRVARAMITVGDFTGVLIVAEEVRKDRNGWVVRRKRISSKDKGDNGAFWRKVAAAGIFLDSLSQSARR